MSKKSEYELEQADLRFRKKQDNSGWIVLAAIVILFFMIASVS